MTHIIRVADQSDAQQINKVAKYLGYDALPEAQAYEKLELLINSSQDHVYVAEVEGEIVGWSHIVYAPRLASESFYEIVGLVVVPKNREKGIGRCLVDYALEHLNAKFRVRCHEKRTESHQFYESIGFKKKKTQYVFEK